MKRRKFYINNRIARQSQAFRNALDYCKIFGLDWHTNIRPMIENGEIVGYYVIDETFSTAVKTIMI